MRAAARQRADTLHSLSPEKLRFDFSFISHIGVDEKNRFRLASLISDKCPSAFDDDLLSISSELVQFTFPFPRTKHDPLSIFELDNTCSVDAVLKITSENLFSRPSIDSLGTAVPEQHFVVQITNQNCILRVVE